MELTDQQVKDFAYSFKLPIPLIRGKYIDYYINLLDPYYETKNKMEIYKNYLEVFKEKDLKNANYNDVVKTIRNMKDFSRYTNSSEISKIISEQKYLPKLEMFQRDHHQKYIISIDLVKADFQSLKYFGFDLFNGKETFNDFIDSYNFHEIIKESKIFRQVIFGSLDSRRQQGMQKHMMLKIADIVRKQDALGRDIEFFSMSSDEIYFLSNKEEFKYVDQIKHEIEKHGFHVKVDHFTINAPFIKPGYYKEFTDGRSKKINLVPRDKLCQFIKLIEGNKFVEEDFLFSGADGEMMKHLDIFYHKIPELDFIKDQKEVKKFRK